MRTLLNEAIPPQCTDEQIFSPAQRIFSQNAVLASLDDLVEVGADGTVMATPSAGAEQAKPAFERGVAILEAPDAFSSRAEHARSKSGLPKKAAPAV